MQNWIVNQRTKLFILFQVLIENYFNLRSFYNNSYGLYIFNKNFLISTQIFVKWKEIFLSFSLELRTCFKTRWPLYGWNIADWTKPLSNYSINQSLAALFNKMRKRMVYVTNIRYKLFFLVLEREWWNLISLLYSFKYSLYKWKS